MNAFLRSALLPVVVSGLLAGCQASSQPGKPVRFPVTVTAAEAAAVVAPFTGVVTSVSVAPGQQVAAGDELAQLDTADLRLALVQATATASTYQTQVEMAQARSDAAALQAARAAARAADARVAALQEQIASARIRSPMDGRAEQMNVEVGQMVKAGAGIGRVIASDRLTAVAHVPATMADALKPGIEGTLRIQGNSDAAPATAVVRNIAEAAQPGSIPDLRAVTLEIAPGTPLKPGDVAVFETSGDAR